ncbi:Glycoside family 29 [Cordyceps militaris]|uniref:alpha-L-fucosidase n=1 Tax=Cordyceps militaris TaxID=73501 RepID=A0A2H4S6H2_CORMI|nr:Glycoside family 29 [Cordyceps militaris]
MVAMMHWLAALTVAASAASGLPSADDVQIAWFSDDAPTISVISPNLTTKWFDGSDFVQIIELFVLNTHKTQFLTKSHNLTVTIASPSLDTVRPGTVVRLAPGQRALVQVGVRNKAGVKAGASCHGKVTAIAGSQTADVALAGFCGISDYESTAESLLAHRTPDWFDKIKYGIFIHWGLYSVPAYGNTRKNENYAEWYWKWQHNPNDKTQTYQYHLKTYGKDLNYDDFAANFTGENFNPKEWVDLFADAGAQYFVPTTKHHDGFALFNFSTSISRRSTVHYGPRRDFIGELFAAARQHQPHLRRGTYFSLPEWYNPQYRHGGSFAGGPPTNPYTGQVLNYTGHVEVGDFVTDVQVPQMEALAYDYGTEIMWCDIGGPNASAGVMARWINWARKSGRQVSFNSRCGLRGDFDTPEYDPNPTHPLDRKWESSRGMDPYSYGYNHVTPAAQYMTGEAIVRSLVDIVASNGNFLLDIGPRGDGAIPSIMQTNLRDAGAWIRAHAEAIFDTTYWAVTANADPFRYTATADAFYIHHVGRPASEVAVPDEVPYLPGDRVTALGGAADGTALGVRWQGLGTLTLELPQSVVDGDRYVWTFKIEYVL